jgi:hypothetical protein
MSKADPNIISGCCRAPMDSWIECREHHVVCTVCKEYSVFRKVGGRVIREVIRVAA